MAVLGRTFIFILFASALVTSPVSCQNCENFTENVCKNGGALNVDDKCIVNTAQRWTQLKIIKEFVSHWDSNIQLEILPTGQLSAANTTTVIEIFKIDKENNSCKLNFDVKVLHTSTNGEFSFIFFKKLTYLFQTLVQY